MPDAPRLVTDEWPLLTELPLADHSIDTPEGHIGVYVRRVSGDGYFTLVGYLAALVVAPSQRGRGIGSRLVRECLGWIEDHKVPFAGINCEPDAVGFYQRIADFREAKNLPGPGVSLIARFEGTPYLWPHMSRIDYREPW